MGSSDFLFARPSFIEGMARTLDIYGVLQEYNKCVTPDEADLCALFNDFKAIGLDIASAMGEIELALKP